MASGMEGARVRRTCWCEGPSSSYASIALKLLRRFIVMMCRRREASRTHDDDDGDGDGGRAEEGDQTAARVDGSVWLGLLRFGLRMVAGGAASLITTAVSEVEWLAAGQHMR